MQLSIWQDQFDTVDFSDNDIRKLEGFPYLRRLKTIIVNNNRICRIATNLEESIPNLEWLVLTNNALEELVSIFVYITHQSFLFVYLLFICLFLLFLFTSVSLLFISSCVGRFGPLGWTAKVDISEVYITPTSKCDCHVGLYMNSVLVYS